jgi:hypothetical protein
MAQPQQLRGGCLTENLPDNDNLDYAILSHTWESEEVTFEDLEKGTGKNKSGFEKNSVLRGAGKMPRFSILLGRHMLPRQVEPSRAERGDHLYVSLVPKGSSLLRISVGCSSC